MPLTNREFEKNMLSHNHQLESIKSEPTVMERISPRGMTLERLDFALGLRNESNSIYFTLLSKRGEKANLKIVLDEKFLYVGNKYSAFIVLLKTEFHDDYQYIRELGIEGPRKKSVAEFSVQAINAYSNLKKKRNILAKVVNIGITAETLDADLAEVGELKDLHDSYTYTTGECQQLTEERDRKYGELYRFMKQLKTILFIVFPIGERQILEKHGIFVRNQPKVKKPNDEPAEPPIPVNPPDDTLVNESTGSTEPTDTTESTGGGDSSGTENIQG
ncbi:MAG: hypothetical protein GY940_41970 [bacterium]|nr:hypothetical protein [bacterium]